jgi:hypothetical protein
VVEGHDQALADLRAAAAQPRIPDERSEALTGEVRMLEQLVQRMGETMKLA